MDRQYKSFGFTLIELSIVLVIIGLIVGGVLVGRDLISAAAVRAQISQIEKYQQAVNTFRGKYGYLPGDIKDPEATQFGFLARDVGKGQGDGDALLLGSIGGVNFKGSYIVNGETGVFWRDLSRAGLVDGSFSTATMVGAYSMPAVQVPLYLPPAKMGSNNFVYVYSPGSCCAWNTTAYVNYFGISQVTGTNGASDPLTSMGLTVQQAYNIDKKLDDGLPQRGNVTATYVTANNAGWTATNAGSASSSTCYDTGSGNYSITQNNGTGVNCALSFKFQ